MVTKIITNENGEPLFKEVTPSEGNALFCQGMEEIEDAFYFISMPINCDESELIEKEIPEEIDLNNLIEKEYKAQEGKI